MRFFIRLLPVLVNILRLPNHQMAAVPAAPAGAGEPAEHGFLALVRGSPSAARRKPWAGAGTYLCPQALPPLMGQKAIERMHDTKERLRTAKY